MRLTNEGLGRQHWAPALLFRSVPVCLLEAWKSSLLDTAPTPPSCPPHSLCHAPALVGTNVSPPWGHAGITRWVFIKLKPGTHLQNSNFSLGGQALVLGCSLASEFSFKNSLGGSNGQSGLRTISLIFFLKGPNSWCFELLAKQSLLQHLCCCNDEASEDHLSTQGHGCVP